MRGLDGKTAIVAGGSTLIGQGVAETLAGYGCAVVIADINVPDGEAAAKKLGGKARFIRCDLTSDADIAALVKATVEATGRLDYPRQCRLHLSRQRRRHGARRLAESLRRQHRRLGHADAGGAAASEKEQRRHRQFRLDLLARRADRPLGLSGVQGRHPATDPQSGDGPRTRRHSRQCGFAGMDLEQHHGRIDQGQPRQDRQRREAVSICSAAPAIQPKSRRLWRSCFRTMRASSPAPTSGSTAATPPWDRSAPIRRYLC